MLLLLISVELGASKKKKFCFKLQVCNLEKYFKRKKKVPEKIPILPQRRKESHPRPAAPGEGPDGRAALGTFMPPAEGHQEVLLWGIQHPAPEECPWRTASSEVTWWTRPERVPEAFGISLHWAFLQAQLLWPPRT